MRLHWQDSIEVPIPVEQVYETLSNFERHPDWSRSIERMEKVRDGDARGVGTRYITHERIEFPPKNGGKPKSSTMRTMCEVRDLVPNRRIAWHAHPMPRRGSAELSFDLAPAPDGGTRITQTVQEYYPLPIEIMIRVLYDVTEDGIRKQLDRGLLTLKDTLTNGTTQI
jgi:uncharacterized protein YndB with AHSA1/START domain